MLQRCTNFLVVLLLICYGEIFAQEKSIVNSSSFAMIPIKFEDNSGERFYMLGKNLYSQQLSFFCRKELQFEKKTSIPLRFRIGSLDYTNYLEQKPNANNFFLKR